VVVGLREGVIFYLCMRMAGPWSPSLSFYFGRLVFLIMYSFSRLVVFVDARFSWATRLIFTLHLHSW
jgi:hypothetical protein